MDEAARIYRAIFQEEVPETLARRFASLPDDVFPPATPDMQSRYERIMREVSDLEALEFASRRAGENRLLTHRFQLMIHLAECQPACRHCFVNSKDHTLGFAIGLVRHGLRCVYKLVRGKWLLRRYHGD